MVFLGCFGILVCLLILYIIRKNRQKTEAILHSAQTDELTQVYSRKYAEQFAENALEEAKDGSIHAFFIMDIDKFKEVNDEMWYFVLSVCCWEDGFVGMILWDESVAMSLLS